MRELAVEFKAARETIAKQLKLFDIPIRSTGSNQNRKRGLAYGIKCQERETRVHKRELENIQKMQELRDKGFSYWKIADVFNSMGIPTKTRKGRWHAKTVQVILSGGGNALIN
jgi:hypothetical protein